MVGRFDYKYSCSRAKPYIRAKDESAIVNCSVPERVIRESPPQFENQICKEHYA